MTPKLATPVSALPQLAVTSIFFSSLCASGFFGRVSISKPFWKLAVTLSWSTLSGNSKERSKVPKLRSDR